MTVTRQHDRLIDGVFVEELTEQHDRLSHILQTIVEI